MAASMTLTAVYESVESGWVQARVQELPSVITAAPTRAEAREMLEDAVREYFLAMQGEAADELPDHEREPLTVMIGD